MAHAQPFVHSNVIGETIAWHGMFTCILITVGCKVSGTTDVYCATSNGTVISALDELDMGQDKHGHPAPTSIPSTAHMTDDMGVEDEEDSITGEVEDTEGSGPEHIADQKCAKYVRKRDTSSTSRQA